MKKAPACLAGASQVQGRFRAYAKALREEFPIDTSSGGDGVPALSMSERGELREGRYVWAWPPMKESKDRGPRAPARPRHEAKAGTYRSWRVSVPAAKVPPSRGLDRKGRGCVSVWSCNPSGA